jgi:hypothetical protein
LLDVHELALAGLKFSQFFYGQTDVSESRGNPQKEADNGQPRLCIEFAVKVLAQPVSDENREGYLKPKAAEISQLLDIAPVFFLQNQYIKMR